MGNKQPKEVVIEIHPVENLSVSVDPKNSTAIVSWEPPSYSNVEVTGYEVSFGASHKTRKVDGPSTTTLGLSTPCDLEPFTLTTFHVRALSDGHTGEWTSTSVYIVCECTLPGCQGNKVRKTDGTLYPFCGKQHAREHAFKYCLLPECGAVKDGAESLLGMYQFFCSQKHIRGAAQAEFLYLLELDSQSLDFKTLSSHFRKSWKQDRGRCPTINAVVAIVNPHFVKRLDDYVATLPPAYRKIERYFHGTTLTCHMGEKEYTDLCNNPNCRVCGICRKNFQRTRFTGGHGTRYGRGFYLAPNSSKANYYAATSGKYKAMFVCDVAPGNKYNLLFIHSDLEGTPQGCHSVYGKTGEGLGDLVDDELVIFDPCAICPRYILLYS